MVPSTPARRAQPAWKLIVVFAARAAAWAWARVAGQQRELAPPAGGAQAAGRAGAAVAGGEGGHDRVLAVLGARCPGRRGAALRAGDGLGVVADGEVGAGVAVTGAGLRGR